MPVVVARLGLGVACFVVIEVVDSVVDDFSSPWLVSLIIGILLGFGIAEAVDEL